MNILIIDLNLFLLRINFFGHTKECFFKGDRWCSQGLAAKSWRHEPVYKVGCGGSHEKFGGKSATNEGNECDYNCRSEVSRLFCFWWISVPVKIVRGCLEKFL